MATGWTIAWSAGLEETADHRVERPCSPVGKVMVEQRKATKPRQGEQKKEQKQKHEHMKDHTILTA